MTASCNGRALSPTLDIPAGATGVQSQTYPGIPAGSVCSATAGPDGGTSTVQVTITGEGHLVSIPAGGVGTVALTDTYTALPGSLIVTKTIAGAAAGQQGAVTVQAVCNGSPLSPTLNVPAGAAAGTYSQTYGAIPRRRGVHGERGGKRLDSYCVRDDKRCGSNGDRTCSPRRRGRHHRYLRSRRGLVESRQDHRWPCRRQAGDGHGPGGVRRVFALAAAKGPGRGGRRHVLAYVPTT